MPESVYYATLARKKRPAKYTALAVDIRAIFVQSRGAAGKRTIQAQLRLKGIKAGLALIAKLMKQQGLVSKQPRKRHRYGESDTQTAAAENLLARNFTPAPAQQVLCGDVTYIKVRERWYYLAVVLELGRRQVVGWKFKAQHNSELVCEALNHAMLKVKAQGNTLFHSDQGSVYRSENFVAAVKRHGLTQSMSRKGNCWDNAPMERWFRSFKHEWMPKGGYASMEDALNDIREYVLYYNHQRPHRFNNGTPPCIKQPIGDCGNG